MRFINKIVAVILIFSLVFTSKEFVTFAESESSVSTQNVDATIVNFEESKANTETTETNIIKEEIENNESTVHLTDEPIDEGPKTIEESEETSEYAEEPEEDEGTTSEEMTSEEETSEELTSEEATSEKVTTEIDETTTDTVSIEETSTNELTAVETTIDKKKILEAIAAETQAPLFGSDPKFRFAYFNEDMSVGLYTFDYAGFSVIPDSVTIAANELGALVYPDKRYNGAVDLGYENYNISWLENNYTWDSEIYTENPMSLSDAYRNWCSSTSPIEDELFCANYAKLSEMTIVQNTIDTEYYMGENFNPDGLRIDVKFANDATDTIEYSDSTRDHFKFYDNDTGDEYTTSTIVNANFTLKIVYGDVEHGSDAISTVSATIDIIALDPSADKGFKVYCQKLDETIECIDYVDGASSEEFTDSIRQFINSEDVASDLVAYQGCYFLNTYTGIDYVPYRTWNDTDVFSFEADFQNKVQEWIDGGKADNKSVGIILQKRQYGDERGNLYIWHFDANATIIKDTFTEIVRMEDFDAFIQELNDSIPSQYNSITGYYKDAWIDYQFYRPDRRPTEEYSGFRDLLISWKTNPSSFSFSDSRKICIAYERKTPESISVSTPPNKVNYQTGDHFDPEGLVITASYPGDINDEVPCDEFREYLFTFDPTTDAELNAANDKINITCCNKSVDLPIYVEPEVASISICNRVKYDNYSVGEKLDASGLSITVYYVGANSRVIEYNTDTASAFSFDPALDHTFEATDVGEKTFTITYGGKQNTFNVNVLENNKFVVHYDVNGVIHSEILEASMSEIESALDAALQSGYTGFYEISASGFCDSKKKYNNTTEQTMTKDQVLEMYDSFVGDNSKFIGAAVHTPAPTPTPTPTPPYNPGGGGGSSGGGGGGGSTVGPMNNQTVLPSQQPIQNEQLNTTNSIPQNSLMSHALLAVTLLSIPENEDIPKTNVIDAYGNTGFGKWLSIPGTKIWYFLAGDMAVNGALGTSGFLADGLYNLSWGTSSGWYSFDAGGVMQTGWKDINGKKYYFEPDVNNARFGMATVGSKMINGKAYNFDANGALITNS